jgi:hypothetical protein
VRQWLGSWIIAVQGSKIASDFEPWNALGNGNKSYLRTNVKLEVTKIKTF